MKTGDISKKLNVTHPTILNWTNEFGEYLSDSARGVGTSHRYYNDQDYIVLATIARLSQDEGLNYSAIQERLKEGYRVDDYVLPNELVSLEAALDLTNLKIELETAKRMVQFYIDQNQAQSEQIERLQQKIWELQYELGKAKGDNASG